MPIQRSDDHAYRAANGERLHMRESVVALVDVLGFSDRIRDAAHSGVTSELLNQLAEFLHPWHEVLDESASIGDSRNWELKFFTDNLVVAHPITTGGEYELDSLIDSLSLFQISAATEGFFLRGGIAVGEFYMDETIAFGLPLLEAHHAESSIANFPRIILAESARQALFTRVRPRQFEQEAPFWHALLEDEDGQIFINYLDASYQGHFDPPDISAIQQHAAAIQNNLVHFNGVARIQPKYEWAARYHNYWCELWDMPEYLITSVGLLKPKRLDELAEAQHEF